MAPILIVVTKPENWPLAVPGVEVVPARSYLTDPSYSEVKGAKVFNLSRSYRYQSIGYYVSLLAEARGHRPMPSVTTIQDLKSQTIVKLVSEDLDRLIQQSLAPIKAKEFQLSVNFGKNLAKRYDRLSRHLFNLFPAPMIRAKFVKDGEGWQLANIAPVPTNEIPDSHRRFLVKVATDYLSGRGAKRTRKSSSRYDLAILLDPEEKDPPSNEKALRRFEKAAVKLGLRPERIDRDDYGRLAEFDALFIRTTTRVDHYTYRFSQRAAAEGLVVIDDPVSIVRCSNKVYLAEALDRSGIPTPKTLVVHRDNVDAVIPTLGLPCILKQPDSSFSMGVIKVETEETFRNEIERLLKNSDLVIAQEFTPTAFDWRVGVLDKKPLFVCRYHMAPEHWQVINHSRKGPDAYGWVDTFDADTAPRQVVRTAVRAANLIGDGLYGVDLKTVGKETYVIEVNDNPNVEQGLEDEILGDRLYHRVMEYFLTRIERRKANP